jgi:hypothetical protein
MEGSSGMGRVRTVKRFGDSGTLSGVVALVEGKDFTAARLIS